jgi:predicted ATP-grasp superfamily ATP-dependent carboligase
MRLRGSSWGSWPWIGRPDFCDRPPPELDLHIPALVVKIGHYPLHHGGLGAVRSLALAGVEVDAVTEDRFTPLALSRYLHQRVVWPTSGTEPAERLLARLVEIGSRRPERTVLVCTDDAAAVLIAEGRDILEDHFLLPAVPHELPRQLASKHGLYQLCVRHGITAPRTIVIESRSDIRSVEDLLGFPVVLKRADSPLAGVRSPIGGTTLVTSDAGLRELASAWQEPFSVLVQEYLPNNFFVDWIVHGYCNAATDAIVAFTGRKLVASPRFANATALGTVCSDPGLLSLARGFCRSIGYRGCFDLDWRQDLRDGSFRLVDFNPRVGAQFRLFEDTAGVDVVRAMHLDLSGRAVPSGYPVEKDCFVVENLELAARISREWSSTGRPLSSARTGCTSRPRSAWVLSSDPLPSVTLAARQLGSSAIAASRRLARR